VARRRKSWMPQQHQGLCQTPRGAQSERWAGTGKKTCRSTHTNPSVSTPMKQVGLARNAGTGGLRCGRGGSSRSWECQPDRRCRVTGARPIPPAGLTAWETHALRGRPAGKPRVETKPATAAMINQPRLDGNPSGRTQQDVRRR
jgi:hypothetical protein